MPEIHSKVFQRVLTLLAALLIVKVTVGVILNYHGYFPPSFDSDFLRGRELYFSGCYQWAFYIHITSAPCSLMLGLILVSDPIRRRLPIWHRCLGRMQVACILLLLTPSGLWMAYYAAAGPTAAVGLAALALVTATCAASGWRSAVKRRFADHRRWMWRTFLLLCSAVVLRLIVGLATVTGVLAAWVDPLAIWLSWLVPLAAFELRERTTRKSRMVQTRASRPGWLGSTPAGRRPQI